jgi:hypothetical protein
MLAARVDDVTLELQVLDIGKDLPTLQKYATVGGKGYVEKHEVGLGLEVWCDEDAGLKGTPFTCYVKWANPVDPKGPPAEVAFRGPVLIFQKGGPKDLKRFLEKIVQVVSVVDRPLSTGPEESAPPE